MSVTTTTSDTTYTGTGSGTAYPVPFVFLDNAHVKVTRTVGTVAQVLAHVTDYTLVGARNPAGGTLTLKAPLAAGAFLRVERVVPLLQSARLRTSGPFSPGALEDALDVAIMGLQQMERERLALTGRVTIAEGGLDSVGERVTSLESKVLGSDVSMLVDAMAEANADIAAHESALTALDGRADALEAGAVAMDGTVSLLTARVTTVEQAALTDQELMAIDNRLDSLETRATGAENDLDAHEDAIDNLDSRLATVEASGGGGGGGDGTWTVPPNSPTKVFHEGNVGINTENPMQALDVVGNVKVSGTGNGYIFPDGSKQTKASSADASTLVQKSGDTMTGPLQFSGITAGASAVTIPQGTTLNLGGGGSPAQLLADANWIHIGGRPLIIDGAIAGWDFQSNNGHFYANTDDRGLKNTNGLLLLSGNPTPSASALAIRLNAARALVDAGSRIAAFQNAGVDKLSVDQDGGIRMHTTGAKITFPDGTTQTTAATGGGGASGVRALQLVASNVLLSSADDVVLVDSSGSSVLVTLPALASVPTGKVVEVRHINDVSSNTVTLKGASTEQIVMSGAPSASVVVGLAATVRVIDAGTGVWFIF